MQQQLLAYLLWEGNHPEAASRSHVYSISSSCVALLAEPRSGLFAQPRLHSTAQHKRRRSRPLAGRCLSPGSWAGSAQRVLLLFTNPVSLYLLVVNLSPLLWSPRIWNARPNVIVHTLKALTIAHSFYYIYVLEPKSSAPLVRLEKSTLSYHGLYTYLAALILYLLMNICT